MSEIERKGGILLSEEAAKNLLLITTPGTVAEAISSALETADATGEPEDSSHLLNLQHPIIPTETFQTTNEDKLFLSSNNNNSLIDLDEDIGNLVRRTSEERLLDGNLGKYNGKASPFHEVHHNQNYANEQAINFPRRKFTSAEDFDTGPEGKDCGRRFLSSSSVRLDADGNHVCEIHDISSACSPYLSSENTKSSSMASENKESSEYYCVNNSHSRSSVGSDQNIRDKPDNREAHSPHSVSHCKEKPATAADEPFESSARSGYLFKPSSKVIELPDRSTSSSIVGGTTTHDRNPHSHGPNHHKIKESKIPVGFVVAWQRLVTSSSSSPTAASAMTTKAEGNPKQKGMNSACSPSKYASRPTSVSPLSTKAAKTNSSTNLNGNNIKSNLAYEARDSQPISDRPLSVCGGEGVGGFVSFPPSSASPLSRPLPSSSVPPNMGFPVGSSYHSPYSLQGYHHRSSTPFLDYPYVGSPNVDRTFAIPSPLSSPHHHPHSPGFLGNGHSYWGGLDSQSVPILTSGIPSSPGAADYLSMQQQIHFHHHHQQHLLASNRQSHLSISSPYNPYLPFIYPHQEATSLGPKSPYFDHYFHHQQNELARQQQLQHQQNNAGGGSANGSNNANNNNNNGSNERSSMRNSRVGGFDLLENNNRSAHQDRAVPMEVANSRTSIPLLSPLPTGGIRTTPSPASGALQAAESAEISAAANTKTSCSTSTTISSSTTATQQTPRQSRSESGLASSSGELSSTYSSCSSASSPSPSFLLIHQQQHPHLFTSSSAALSPKSLTSSTPSPVTVHDFNSGLNVVVGSSSSNNNLTASSSSNNCGGGNNTMLTTRKCATPSPISLTPRPLLSPFGSPFSPSSINNNNGTYKDLVWKQERLSSSSAAKIKPVPINGHCNNSLAPGDQRGNAESPLTTTPTTSPLLHRRSRQLSVPTPLSSPNSQKHDFKRLESLIERRDSESISPLVLIPQHSPATSTTSSMLDGEEVRAILQGDGGDCEQKGNTSFTVFKVEEDIEDKCRGKDDDDDDDGDVETERLGTNRESNGDVASGSKADIHSTAAACANSGNDLFKVKQRHSSGGLPFPNEETKDVVMKAEKVLCVESCAMKSEPVANKNTTISSCDVKKTNMMESPPINENQLDGGDDDNVDDKIERNVVPESTLPFSSSCKSSSYNNDIPKYTYVKNDAVSAINTESCHDRQSEKKQQQSTPVKHDISLTSGYSSNDEIDTSARIFNSSSTLKPKTKNNAKKGELKCKKLSPSFKIKGKKVKEAGSAKKVKDRKGKSLKSNSSDKTTTKAGKPKKTKLKGKTLMDWDVDENPKKRKKLKAHQNTNPPPNSAELVNEDFVLLSSSNNSIKKKEKGKLSRVLTAKRKDNGKLSLKTGRRKDQGNKMSPPVKNSVNTVIHDSSHDMKMSTRNKRDTKMKKNGKVGKQGTLGEKNLGGSDSNANNKSQFLIASPRQEHCSKMSTLGSSKQHGANVIGDISGKGNNCSFTGDHNNSLTISTSLDPTVSSPPSDPTQQQPVALILQSSSSSSSLQTTTLRIPAYVPRSSATIVGSESFSSVMTDELVGDQDNYNGPATLTLHCDVDALAQQQQQIYYPQESLPPAITIQYHHSAPATPLMPLMDAASPLIKPEENSLNLLATVAQEFGSREDLGKRLSIDGSCNNSIIGESPPMSPMRSPCYPVKTLQHPQFKQQKYQSCIAPTSDPSKGIISDVVREVVELYHNDRSCSFDKLKTKQKKEELKKVKKARKMGEKTSNSIIAKKTKGLKAGKKEKRSISDGGPYSQNVVLKIPQVQRQILPDKPKLEKGKKLKKSGEKVKEKKSAKLSLLLPLNIDNQKKGKREKSSETGKAKKATKSEKNISGDGLETATLSVAGSSSTSLLKLTDRTPSPKKEKVSKSPGTSSSSSCFYSPPERISAFAKQVIARRDSVVASGSAPSSPTKIPVGSLSTNPSSPSKTTTSSDFFPVMKQQQLISPKEHCLTDPHSTVVRSPSVKMPLLTPFDLEQQSKLSKETAFTFSLAVPPPLVPSVSSGSRKAGLHHRDHHSTKIPKQDKEKTDMLVDGSPSSSSNNLSSKDMVKVKRKKKDKTNSLDDEKGQKQPKKKMKRKHDLPSGEDETGVSKLTKKKNRKSESIPSVEVQRTIPSPPRAVPKITITSTGKESLSRQYSFSSSSNTAFRTFSPLTPPPTAKSPLDDEHGTGTGELSVLNVASSTPSSSHLSSPSNLENEEQGEAETTENENENDPNNVWVADPMFAVSAIKLSSSNQPSDTSSIGGDLSSFEDIDDIEKTRKNKKKSRSSSGGRKDSRPPKLSLYNKNSCQQEPENISADPRFLEVKSELKAFVHFKPKQLTSNKKGHCHIKPCLKAEPVVRSQSEDDDDEDEEVQVVDEDFELDLEVATITTQKPPKDGHKSKHPNPSSATSIISGSGKKQSINRNSLSYLSSSSSKKHQPSVAPLSTKEIMTKVFSRKVSPELAGARRKQHHHSHSSKKRYVSGTTGVAHEDEDELLDIEEPLPITKHNYHHHQHHHNAHVSMCAAAAAVIVQSSANPSASSPTLPSTQIATVTASPSKKSPKKRSARSSTTSSSASTKSSCRGQRGQSAFSHSSTNAVAGGSSASQEKDETLSPGKVELDSVGELVDEMRILTEIQGLFYTGRLNALQPPDVYGVTLDNERGAPPHLIFSAEEVLEKCLREKKPHALTSGLRICAYWSPQYSGLYPGRVSSEFNPKFDPEEDLIPIEFDDGDTGMIKLKEIRLLSVNHPVREYDPNPLLTLEKKHRKRRHSSATGTSGGCTGDHDEPDCGEPYCAKIGKLEEDEEEDGDDDQHTSDTGRHHSSKMMYWTWSGLGYKRPKNKKNKNKEFFHGIQRGDEAINVGDAALFISTGNERPFIGRVERFWECKGKKMVNVRWFYHPEEVKASAKRLSNLKYPGALFESPHIDENDVQTIAKKCDVLPFAQYKQRLCATSSGSPRLAKLSTKSSSKPRDMYYVAGFYDPYTYNLTLKDLK